MQLPSELIVALSRAYALTEIIPLHHSTVRDALRSVAGLLRANEGVQASISEQGLIVGDDPVEDSQGLTREFARDLRAVGATGIRVPRDATIQDVERLIVALRATINGGQHSVTDGLEEDLAGGVLVAFKDGSTAAFQGARSEEAEPAGLGQSINRMFEVRGGQAQNGDEAPEIPDLSGVEFPDEVDEPSPGESGEDGLEEFAIEEDPAEATLEAGAEASDDRKADAETEGVTFEPEESPVRAERSARPAGADDGDEIDDGTLSFDDGPLVDMVLEYVRAGCPDDMAERIRGGAENPETMIDWIGNAVEQLTRAVVEDRADDGALELARDLADPRVSRRLTARIGTVWDEIQRHTLLRQMALLPEQMAPALAEALADETDRRSRRTFMEAMLSMGERGMEEVEKMVDDSRWFVVRNAAAILGEVGGEQSVEHLTAILSHEDPRVRRETVLALAKIGGEDAGVLVLGMLDDADTDVRATVCRALGVLKVERALRPLLARLEEDDEQEIQEQILLALGQLGDPGAVQAIERRAGGGFFSRPAKDIRIAAYRALAAIGTPHAMEVLEGAAGDRDTDVRSTVQALLESR